MQYVFNDRRTYITSIEFRNTVPIVNIERIRSFKEEGVTGNFTNKEFRYSFDNVIWSTWQTLTIANISAINFADQENFYLHVKYSRNKVIDGNINAFYLLYDSRKVSPPSPDSSIIDADLLQGEDGAYYLDRTHQYGPFTDLKVYNVVEPDTSIIIGTFNSRIDDSTGTILYFRSLTSDSSGLTLSVNPSGIITLHTGIVNVGSQIESFIDYDSQGNAQFRTFVGAGAAQVYQSGDNIVISIDASFGGEVNYGVNIGSGDVSIYKEKTLEALIFRTLKSGNGIILSYQDADTIRIDVSNYVSKIYVDSSINNIRSTYIPNSSLGTDFQWDTSGYLAISVSAQGIQGTQGIAGYQGSDGVQGIQGLQGTQGIAGYQGSNGVQGIQGGQGTQGTQGQIGSQGTQGTQGQTGSQGTQGIQGSQGIQGIQGIEGSQGTQGIQGGQGTQGIQGISYSDASLNQILSQYILSSSIGYGLVWNGSGYLDVCVGLTGHDPSIDQLFGLTGNTDYTSNLFVNDYDNLTTSISNLDQIMGLIAPAKPDLLTGKDPSLIATTTTKYTAKLPSGLSSTWYIDATSGSTITSYIVDTTFRMYTPSFSIAQPTFRAGLFQDSAAAGVLYPLINNSSLGIYYDMTLGVGNVSIGSIDVSGYIRCSSISGFGGAGNNFWRKAEAYIDITNQREGEVYYGFKHTEALTSNNVSLYYDDVASAASFLVNGSANVLSDVSIYLSGISYYGLNATFTATYVAAAGIFRKAYHPTTVSTLTSTFGSTVTTNPVSPPNVDASFAVSTTFTFNTASQSSGASNATIVANLYKPLGSAVTSTITLPRRADTWSQSRATTTAEYFTDESRRLYNASSGTDTVFNSLDYNLFNPSNGSYAQVQNGTLRYPVSADYAGFSFSGTDKMYIRRFTKAAASSGVFTFTGFAPNTQLSPYGSGDVNVLIWLTDQGLYFDPYYALGIGGGGGTTMATAISAGNGSLTSTTIPWTLGTYSTGNEVAHVGTYVIIVIFRTTTRTMTSITSS